MKTNPVDVGAAWDKVSSKMKHSTSTQEDAVESPTIIKRILKIGGYAATVALLITVGVLMKDSNPNTQLSTTDIAMSHELEDGSVINLGKNSALSKLDNGQRSYSFSGEAEFQIVHDDNNPFVVHMNGILVKDLGTVFHIESIPMNDTVFVSVTEGIAQFYTLTASGIILESGEEGMYIKSKDRFYKRSIDAGKQFLSIAFQNATLGEVIDHLSYSFRKNISIKNEAIRNCNLTVDFSKAPFSMVVEIIGETLDLDIQSEHDSLTIDGKGCD